jgi:hypothetical protein
MKLLNAGLKRSIGRSSQTPSNFYIFFRLLKISSLIFDQEIESPCNFISVLVLCICYFENHFFLVPESSITAFDVLNRRCKTARLFQSCIAKHFFIGGHRQKLSAPRKETHTRMLRRGRLKPHAARVHKHQGIVAQSVLNDNTHVIQTSKLVVGNKKVALCPFTRLLQAHRLLDVGAEIF